MSANEEEGAVGDLKGGHAPAGILWKLMLFPQHLLSEFLARFGI